MISTKNKNVFKTLLNEWRYPIVIRNWRTTIFLKIKNIAWAIFLTPYYKLKWFKLNLSTKYMHFITWELKNPLKINYQSRSTFEHCTLCKEKYCNAIKDRFFERYIWSDKIKYIETVGTCETRLFEPHESYLSSGGEDGGAYFGHSSTWSTVEKGGERICL